MSRRPRRPGRGRGRGGRRPRGHLGRRLPGPDVRRLAAQLVSDVLSGMGAARTVERY
ncbi:MAG: hypothetical protein R3F62_29830 [Planctomycetota bacterium]